MKTFKTILAAFAIAFGAMTASAQSMSYEAMRNNARFLTDRMAYELGIRSMSVIDDIYRINFDYIYGVNEYLDEVALGYFYDDYMELCARRDYALRRLLGDIVWNRLLGYSYFHRPIIFSNHRWHFGIYDYDRYGVHHYFYREPRHFHRDYRGGHFFHGMAPSGGHIHRPTPQPHRDGARGGMNNRPQGGNDRPQGGMNNRPQGGANNGGMNRPQGGNDRPQGGMNNRPQGGANNGGMNRPQGGNDHPQGGVNNGGLNRPQGGMNDRPNGANSGGISRSQGGSASRGSSTGRSDNNMRSSSRSSGGSSYTPSRSGATRGGGNAGGGSRGGSHSGGGSRGGRR